MNKKIAILISSTLIAASSMIAGGKTQGFSSLTQTPMYSSYHTLSSEATKILLRQQISHESADVQKLLAYHLEPWNALLPFSKGTNLKNVFSDRTAAKYPAVLKETVEFTMQLVRDGEIKNFTTISPNLRNLNAKIDAVMKECANAFHVADSNDDTSGRLKPQDLLYEETFQTFTHYEAYQHILHAWKSLVILWEQKATTNNVECKGACDTLTKAIEQLERIDVSSLKEAHDRHQQYMLKNIWKKSHSDWHHAQKFWKHCFNTVDKEYKHALKKLEKVLGHEKKHHSHHMSHDHHKHNKHGKKH